MNIYISKITTNKNLSIEILKYAYKDIYNKEIDLLKIKKNKYGKPYYDNKFYYNISHSKNYICIVTGKSEVGIDMEEERILHTDISKRIFSKDETVINNNILNNWCIKEAYSKYLGLGFYKSFKEVNSNHLLNDKNLYNLSNNDYYCYVYGLEEIEKIEIIGGGILK